MIWAKPKVGESVYVEGRKPQPNGIVISVNWQEHETIVLFHNNGGTEMYNFEDFCLRQSNQWILQHVDDNPPDHRLDVQIFFDMCLSETEWFTDGQPPHIGDAKLERLLFLSKYFKPGDPRFDQLTVLVE